MAQYITRQTNIVSDNSNMYNQIRLKPIHLCYPSSDRTLNLNIRQYQLSTTGRRLAVFTVTRLRAAPSIMTTYRPFAASKRTHRPTRPFRADEAVSECNCTRVPGGYSSLKLTGFTDILRAVSVRVTEHRPSAMSYRPHRPVSPLNFAEESECSTTGVLGGKTLTIRSDAMWYLRAPFVS